MKSEANISNQKFHALNGVNDIPRSEIETIVDLAKQENNAEVIYRLSKVLRNNPDAETFNMTIAKYPATGLNGAQHTGDYKEALDDCGRLRPGYRFMGGKVVKVVSKPKKEAKIKTKTAVKKEPVKNTKSVVKTAKNDKIKADKITILWAEGDNSEYDKFPKDYKTFAEAHKAVFPIYYDSIKHNDGGYNKVKFLITFTDGETYEGRLDVSEKEDNPTKSNNVIGVHVKEWYDYYLKNLAKTEQEKQEILEYLAKYSFEDDNKVVSKSTEIETMKINLADYLFDEKHPLLVLSENSPQFKSALKEFEKEVAKFGSENPGHWILKSAIKKETPAEKPTDSTETNYPFSKEDIPYKVAYNAHSGTSFSPEKRAVQEQEGYFADLKEDYDTYKPKAEAKGKLSEFEAQFARFQSGYLKRKLDYLYSRNGLVSTMIVGGSKFPVARMNKKNDVIHKKQGEFLNWYNTGIKRIKDILLDESQKPIKSGSENALTLLKEKLRKEEKAHEATLIFNKIMRKKTSNEAKEKELLENGFGEKVIYELRNKGFFELPSYVSANRHGRIRELKSRIAAEEKLKERAEDSSVNKNYVFDGGTVELDYSENRVKIYFDSIPNVATRSQLKGRGYAFKWSPKNKAWQRQLNTFRLANLESILPNFRPENDNVKVVPLKVEKEPETVKSNKFDFIFEVSHGGGYVVKSFLDLPLSKSVKNKKLSDSVDGLFYYDATEKGLNELKKAYPNNAYGDKQNLGVKDLNKPLSLFGAKKKGKKPLKGIVESLATNLLANSLMAPAANSNPNSLASRMNQRANAKHEYYTVADKEISKFLGNIEKKTKESVAITIAGGQGSMKTRFCFQLMNALAQNYKVGHASIEEHPESALYFDKAKQYCNDKALHNISAPEINSIEDVHKLTRENDVIVIDSFSKLQEMDKNCQLDKDFRKAYDGKLFIIIYQLTSDGKMRGGAKSQFDGDCIAFIEKKPNYTENYVWWDKNRYQSTPELKYNIYSGKIQKEPEPEAPKQKDKPKTETFSFEIV